MHLLAFFLIPNDLIILVIHPVVLCRVDAKERSYRLIVALDSSQKRRSRKGEAPTWDLHPFLHEQRTFPVLYTWRKLPLEVALISLPPVC